MTHGRLIDRQAHRAIVNLRKTRRPRGRHGGAAVKPGPGRSHLVRRAALTRRQLLRYAREMGWRG